MNGSFSHLQALGPTTNLVNNIKGGLLAIRWTWPPEHGASKKRVEEGVLQTYSYLKDFKHHHISL